MIKYTKRGQPYKIMPNGKARFLKLSSSTRRKSNRGVKTMARKKSYFKRAKSSGITGTLMTLLISGLYGAAREKIASNPSFIQASNYLPVPAGLKDEALFGGIAIAAKHFIKNPMIKDVANKMLIVEGSRIGATMGAGNTQSTQSSFYTSTY